MASTAPHGFSLTHLASVIGAELVGSASREIIITGIAPIERAAATDLTFVSKPAFEHHLATTRAGAVIVSHKCQATCPRPLLKVSNPYLAYAQLTAIFDTAPVLAAGIHSTAFVDPSAQIHPSATIGPHVVVEANARIGAATVIQAGSVIGASTVIGQKCLLHRNVTIYHDVVIGDQVIIHSGAVVGSDGFGNAPKPGGGWQKIYQLGRVVIGSNVDIGANTTIDRGALEDTVIEDGVIIDNLVHVAHNVHIGKNTAIAACTGIAGSTTIGANCTIAGQVGITGHIAIADNVHITGMTMVTNSIKQAGIYSSGIPHSTNKEWRRNAVRFNQLDELAKRVRALEKSGIPGAEKA